MLIAALCPPCHLRVLVTSDSYSLQYMAMLGLAVMLFCIYYAEVCWNSWICGVLTFTKLEALYPFLRSCSFCGNTRGLPVGFTSLVFPLFQFEIVSVPELSLISSSLLSYVLFLLFNVVFIPVVSSVLFIPESVGRLFCFKNVLHVGIWCAQPFFYLLEYME